MKKIYFLFFAFLFFNGLSAQIINFPDANFKAKLLQTSSTKYIALDINDNPLKIDFNNDGEIQVDEALKIYGLTVANSQISNLKGIENFANLKKLDCEINLLTSLDVKTLTNLTSLECWNNQLTNLDVSTLINLNNLNCSQNQLTNLDVSALTNLNSLVCAENQLTNLNVAGLTSLNELACQTNQLTNLDVSTLTKLNLLSCFENKLTSLDLSGMNTLVTLLCDSNEISNLDIKSNLYLEFLWCQRNQLSNLDVTGLTKLDQLIIDSNQITTIDIKGLANLSFFSFDNNQIASIDFSNLPKLETISGPLNPIEVIDVSQVPNLQTLLMGFTPIQSLDLSNSKKLKTVNVSNCPNLELISLKNGSVEELDSYDSFFLNGVTMDSSNFSNCPNLKYICADEEELETISRKIANYNYTDCVIGGYCSFDEGGENYSIQGNNRIDSNNNGCDVSDLPAPNVKFTISEGSKTETIITNKSGDYLIKVQDGTYTITPTIENANYFTISPTSVNVTFPTDVNPFIQDFCITPIDTHKDLEITLIPLEVARPGFDTKYKFIYKNKGNVVQSGTVNLAFDDTVLDAVISNPVISSQNTNNLSWNFSNLQPFEVREITFTLNVNSPMETPAVNSGAILHYTATINSADTDENPNDNMFVFDHTVVGSLDPNYKTCLEGTVITPSLIGEYVHYLIRFENTGNYAAQNIVVKDMIDLTKFDISTLVPTDASHTYITKISDGNKVEFIFENINLPFDYASNDGYIAFKIKTKPTLVVGDSFENTANIFFDYNFPVETNTAKTTYKTVLGTSDFEFTKYVSVYPIPATTILNISAKSNIEIQSIAVYDILGQLVIAIPNAEKITSVDVSNLRTGNYFIKIKSDKGSSSLKFIKN